MTPAHVSNDGGPRRLDERLALDRCGGLSDVQRKRDMGAFFKSIHGTFDHLISEISPG